MSSIAFGMTQRLLPGIDKRTFLPVLGPVAEKYPHMDICQKPLKLGRRNAVTEIAVQQIMGNAGAVPNDGLEDTTSPTAMRPPRGLRRRPPVDLPRSPSSDS
jgi:hypothetical protein